MTNDLFSLTNDLNVLMNIKFEPDSTVLMHEYFIDMQYITLSAILIIHNFMIGFKRSGGWKGGMPHIKKK